MIKLTYIDEKSKPRVIQEEGIEENISYPDSNLENEEEF
jgi:hypothetical protein